MTLTQQVKAFVTKLDHRSPIPRAHMVGENEILQLVLRQ